MHIRVQVVKKGRKRNRNSERNFDNISENDMILHEFKYDFKNKNFPQWNKQSYKVSQKAMSGNIFLMQIILNICLNFWRQSHTTKLQYNLSMKKIFWFFQETCKTILFPIFLRFHRGRNNFYLPNRIRLQDNVMKEHV